MNKKVFTTKDEDGKTVELATKKPTAAQRVQSQLVYNKAWKIAEAAGCTLRRSLDDLARKHGVWDDEKVARVRELETQIISKEKQLRSGANSFKSVEDAKQCALDIRKLRGERMDLLRSRDELYSYTAESYADDVRIKYFIAETTVNNESGVPYFKSYDDFLEKSETDAARDSLVNYIQMTVEDLPDENASLFENQFLLKYKLVDEKYRLVNKDGHLIAEDGRLIDEEGYYVDKTGKRCDRDGTPVGKDGEYDIEFKEFTPSDDGKNLSEPVIAAAEPPTELVVEEEDHLIDEQTTS